VQEFGSLGAVLLCIQGTLGNLRGFRNGPCFHGGGFIVMLAYSVAGLVAFLTGGVYPAFHGFFGEDSGA